MGRLGLVVMFALASVSSVARARAEERPTPDTGTGPIAVPAVPSFDMLVPSAKALGVLQLRVMGRREHLDKPVVVRGYVTLVYDCVTENMEPDKTRAQIAKIVAADPKKCEPTKLYLGDTKTTPKEFSLHIADIKKAAWKVGDYLEVSGTFGYASPGGDKDRAGLVVYGSAKKVKPEKSSTAQLPAKHTVTALVVPKPIKASARPRDIKAIDAAMRKAKDQWGDWKTAVAEFRKAIALWDGNDVAWFWMGRAAEEPGMFEVAVEGFEKAFALVPTQAVYAFKYGRALWLRDYYRVRYAEAKRQGIHEEYLELSGTEANLNLDAAQQILEYAITLVPDQWEAHDVLADIHIANQDPKAAAEEWTKAIARGPTPYFPYFQLASLYRSWGYEDQALDVVKAWTSVRKPDDYFERMYELAARAYLAKGDVPKALEMLDAILAKPGRETEDAALLRAEIYVSKKRYDDARKDLAPFPTHRAHKMREVNVILSRIPKKK